ncbi:MAG: NFACT family protein [Candidatus Nanopusillus sp.]|nr:NFACT family protein [Candidatus Nanopusillus sp.]
MINYFELKKWYNDNAEKINNSIVKNIYNIEDGVVFELYKPGLENKFLYIIPGKIIFLYNVKEREEINKFTLKLRKDFNETKINIEIDNNDKIIIIKNNEKKLYIELFPNGLLIVTDYNDTILYANQYKNFGVRKIFRNEKYIKPPGSINIINNINEFFEKVNNTNKKDVVRFLAIDLSLGGKYSEYIIKKANIEKNKSPKELNKEEIERIYNIYNDIVNLKIIIDENGNIIEDINKYFINLYLNSRENKRIRKLNEEKEKIKRIIEEQKKYLEEINNEIYKLEKIGEFLNIYSWIFKDYDVNNIIKNFREINIDIDIKRDNRYLIINIDDKYLENK